MRRLLAVLLLCACSRESALHLIITTAPQRPDSCFEVAVRAPRGEALETAGLARPSGAAEADVVIYQGTKFPEEVELTVNAWVADGGCDEPRTPNGVITVPARFSRGISAVEAKLETLADADEDSAVALAAGGADCDDDAPSRSPFAAEDCGQAGDFDCDGFSRCSDTECAAQCEGVASVLSFANPPLTVRQSACSAALRLEARDPFGNPAALPFGLSVTAPGVTFYGSSNCTGSVPPSIPIGGLSVYASAAQPGTVTISAAAAGVTTATQPLVVTPLPTITLFSAAAPHVATNCITQHVQLLEVDGGAYLTGAPIEVSLSAGAAPLTLFDDCTSRQQRTNVTINGTANTAFGFSTPRAGPLTLTATAPNFAAGSVSYLVAPGPVFATALDAGDPLYAATCNPVTLSWTDDAGNPVAPTELEVDTTVPLFSDPACANAGVGDPMANQTIYARPGDQGAFPFSVDAGSTGAATTLNVVRPFPPGAVLELPLRVQTGSNRPYNGYEGYSTVVLIDAGAPLPDDMNLLRAYFWGNAGWRELDRVYGGHTVGYQIWFKSQGDLGDSATDDHYSFFVMDPGSPPAKASPHEVWLFFDDFENGLSRWSDAGTQWLHSTDGGFASNGALTNLGNDSGVELTIAPLLPLDERDVSFQAWWRSPDFANVDFGQQIRVQQTDGGPTFVGHEVGGGAWRTATYVAPGNYVKHDDIKNDTAGTVLDGWSEVLVRMCDDDFYGHAPGGSRANNLSQSLPPGSIGFRASFLTKAPVSIDSVVVRRYACPEPYTAVLAPRTAP